MTVPSRGWYVEVTDASGYVHRAEATAQVQPNKKANDRPEIRVPVPRAAKWDAILDPDADIGMAVWNDGKRVPIDTLEDVEQEPGQSVLVGSGGSELTTRVEKAYDQEPVHTAVNDLVDNNTTYPSNVDTPPTTTQASQDLADWTNRADFQSNLSAPIAETDPIVVNSGDIALAQSGWFGDGGTPDDSNGGSFNTPTGHSDTGVRRMSAVGDWIEFDTDTLDYTIPSAQINPFVAGGTRYGIRAQPEDTNNVPEVTVYVKADQASAFTQLEVLNSFSAGFNWQTTQNIAFPDLPSGESYTLRFEITDTAPSNEYIEIDAGWIGDGRYSYTFDNSVASDGDPLDGPEEYPDEETIAFGTVPATQAVTGATATITNNNSNSVNQIALSNDQGETFDTSGNDVSTFDTDFSNPTFGPGVDVEITLARFGTGGSTSPATGFNGENIQSLDIDVDLEDMPLVVNRSFDGHLDDVITQLTELADALWSLDYDPSQDTITVEWSTVGQRTSTNTPQIVDYTRSKSTRDVYQSAAVYGTSDVPVRGEVFTSNNGSAVALKRDRIQPESEQVRDINSGKVYRRQVDYTMDYQAGTITTLGSGGISDGVNYVIDYVFQAFGEYDDGTPTPAQAPPVEIPGLPSDFLCQQAARLIIDEVSDPLYTATVTIPNEVSDWSVVDSFDPAIVPTDGNALHVREVENTPEQTVLTLGSRRSFADVVNDIRAQVSAVARKA